MTEWVLVPREPTRDMTRAMEAQWIVGATTDMARREWKAAIDAAPDAPQQAEPVWARPDQLRQVPFLCSIYSTKVAPDLVPLYLHPPADEVQRLRDAASALCGALTASELNDRAYHALNKLHRALEGK